MRVPATVIALLASMVSVLACANLSGNTKFNGESGGSLITSRTLRSALRVKTADKGIQIERELRGATGLTNRSDYAVALMFLGRSKEAVTILSELENQQPGIYFVAANLGTAHELSGNNREALRWIQEGILRNPKSHDGTEWLHVKILEAKIRREQASDYFEKHSVLDLDPNEIVNGTPVLPAGISVAGLRDAIKYQLQERLQFVKPPDPSVAGLLVDLGAAEAVAGTLESAKDILKMAVEFGVPQAKVQPMVDQFDHVISWRHTKTNRWIAAGVVGFLALLAYLYKRGIFVLSSKDLKR